MHPSHLQNVLGTLRKTAGHKGIRVLSHDITSIDASSATGILTSLDILSECDIICCFLGKLSPSPIGDLALKAATNAGHFWMGDIPGRSALEYCLRHAIRPDATQSTLVWVNGSLSEWHESITKQAKQRPQCTVEAFQDEARGATKMANALSQLVQPLRQNTVPGIIATSQAYVHNAAGLHGLAEVCPW